MEKKDIRSDLLRSFGMESHAFTWLEEIKRNISPDEKMYNLTVPKIGKRSWVHIQNFVSGAVCVSKLRQSQSPQG